MSSFIYILSSSVWYMLLFYSNMSILLLYQEICELQCMLDVIILLYFAYDRAFYFNKHISRPCHGYHINIRTHCPRPPHSRVVESVGWLGAMGSDDNRIHAKPCISGCFPKANKEVQVYTL